MATHLSALPIAALVLAFVVVVLVALVLIVVVTILVVVVAILIVVVPILVVMVPIVIVVVSIAIVVLIALVHDRWNDGAARAAGSDHGISHRHRALRKGVPNKGSAGDRHVSTRENSSQHR
jgi:hypothetical protein